jgi:hypothetical protein
VDVERRHQLATIRFDSLYADAQFFSDPLGRVPFRDCLQNFALAGSFLACGWTVLDIIRALAFAEVNSASIARSSPQQRPRLSG